MGENGQVRGREAVRGRLIEAAIELLADRSPATVTSKEIASLAGVNHGQIHHYFSSKDHLVATALQADARRSADLAGELLAQRPPVPIDTDHRPRMWRTLAHLAVSEAWTTDAYERSPVVGQMVRGLAAQQSREPSDPRVLGQVAAILALELGWDVFRDMIEAALEEFEADGPEVRRILSQLSIRLVDDVDQSD